MRKPAYFYAEQYGIPEKAPLMLFFTTVFTVLCLYIEDLQNCKDCAQRPNLKKNMVYGTLFRS
jgi:hypothetical protein